MTTEHKQRMQQDHDDAALELLMQEYAEIEGEALWREFQAAEAARNDPSAQDREHRKSRRRGKDTCRRIDFLKCIGKTCKRAAVLFLVLVLLMSPLITSVEAFKLPVLNYLVTLEQAFSGFTFGRNEDPRRETESLVALICSVDPPKKHEFSRYEITPNGKIWICFDCEGRETLRISVFSSDGQVNIDTEDVEQVSMEIHGYDATYLQKHGHRLIWMDAERELIFEVHAFELEEEDFWKYVYRLIACLSQ